MTHEPNRPRGRFSLVRGVAAPRCGHGSPPLWPLRAGPVPRSGRRTRQPQRPAGARRTAARQEGSRSSSSCAGITTPTALITPAVASSLSLEQAETLDRFVTVGQRAARRARPGSVRDALHGGRSAWPHPCQPRSPAPPTGRPGHCPAARVRYPGAERRGPGSSARRWLSTPAGRRAAGQRAREGQALAASSGAGLHSGGPRMRPRR